MRLVNRFPSPDLVRFLMEESELEREEELLEGSVEGRPISEKGVPERMSFLKFAFKTFLKLKVQIVLLFIVMFAN